MGVSIGEILPTVFPGLGLSKAPGYDPVGDYLHSLERLAPFDAIEVVPGHGIVSEGSRGGAEHPLVTG